jgi:hypothetical protein
MAVKYNKWPKNMPNVRKMYQIDTKLYQHLPTSRPFKIGPKWDFWFVTTMSHGNHAASHKHDMV